MKIKICEFESLEESVGASRLGIDAMGFHLFSRQNVAEKTGLFRGIFRQLPPGPQRILLTDLADDPLEEAVARLRPEAIQFYPATSPDHHRRLRERLRKIVPGLALWKVVSAEKRERPCATDEELIDAFSPHVDVFLLDTNLAGGTGRTHDWEWSRRFIARSPKPVFLAGGLAAGNVQAAIRHCRPHGVDVETGVSDRLANGGWVKNMDKIREFVEAVRGT